ncbi:MAG: ATP-binding protein [Candidatus Velthaea sp.]|jgi:hypothetical protein
MASHNPYRTAPGSVPPELAGRDSELGAARYAIAMTNAGAPAKPIVFTGLRGMGKTALLRQCVSEARAAGGLAITAEADKTLRFTDVMRRELAAALSGSESLPKRLASAIGYLAERLPRISYELPHSAGSVSLASANATDEEPVRSDSLEDVLLTLNEQLRRHGRFLLIALDEIQESPTGDLLRIIRVVHKSAGTPEPSLLLCAGLPNTAGVLKTVRTYTERYAYLNLGLLTAAATVEAVDVPARKIGVRWEPAAAAKLYALSQGYPYFVQEFASAAWLAHHGDVITAADVERVALGVQTMLDESIFSRQFAQISPREALYVLALHRLGPGTHHSEEIAGALGLASSELGSVRSQLMKKDVLFAPSRGLTEFRLPLTDAYIDRHIEAITKRASLGHNALNPGTSPPPQ